MRSLLISVAASLLFACSSSPGDSLDGTPGTADPTDSARANPRPDEASTLTLTSFKVHDGLGNTGPLALDSLRQLSIETAYMAAPGSHSQVIDVFDPHGTLYGTLKAQVVADANGYALATQSLEVGGTSIEQFHMAGTWQFVLIVDGQGLASVTLEVVD